MRVASHVIEIGNELSQTLAFLGLCGAWAAWVLRPHRPKPWERK